MTIKKISIFLTPILILIFSIIIATEKKVEQQQQTYVPQVIINAPWGNKPGEFGLYDPYRSNPNAYDQGPVQGPSNFTVSLNTDIYICDIFNERIQRFSADGHLISVIDIGGWRGYGDDISVDEIENIYVLYSSYSPARVCKFDQGGNLLIEYVSFKDEDSKGMEVGGGSTRIYCDNSGKLFLSYYKMKERAQMVFQLGTSETEFSPEQQKTTLRRGFVGVSGLILNKGCILQNLNGKLTSVDESGNPVTEFKVSAGGFSFFDTDAQDNVYLHDFIQKDDELIQKVRKYTKDGVFVSEIEWKDEGYAIHNLNKSLTVDAEGNIYVFDSNRDGITLTKWSPAGK